MGSIPDGSLDAMTAATVPAEGDIDCDDQFSGMCRCVRESGHAGNHRCLCTAEDLSDGAAMMPSMNTATNPIPVPIPVGATRAEALDRDGRMFYGSTSVTIEASGWLDEDVTISTGGLQNIDGTYEWKIWAGPIHPDMPITAAQARQIGEALIAAADELDAVNSAKEGAVTIYNPNSGAVAIVPIERVAETVRPWFPNASDAVRDAIAELQQTLNMGRCPDGLTAFLGITIDGDRYDLQRRAELRALDAMEVAR